MHHAFNMGYPESYSGRATKIDLTCRIVERLAQDSDTVLIRVRIAVRQLRIEIDNELTLR